MKVNEADENSPLYFEHIYCDWLIQRLIATFSPQTKQFFSRYNKIDEYFLKTVFHFMYYTISSLGTLKKRFHIRIVLLIPTRFGFIKAISPVYKTKPIEVRVHMCTLQQQNRQKKFLHRQKFV